MAVREDQKLATVPVTLLAPRVKLAQSHSSDGTARMAAV